MYDLQMFSPILGTGSNFKTEHKVYSNKHSVILVKDRYIDQWNKIESTEIDLQKYVELIFYK